MVGEDITAKTRRRQEGVRGKRGEGRRKRGGVVDWVTQLRAARRLATPQRWRRHAQRPATSASRRGLGVFRVDEVAGRWESRLYTVLGTRWRDCAVPRA